MMTYKILVVRHLLKKLNLLFLKSSYKETLEPDGYNIEFSQLFKKEITLSCTNLLINRKKKLTSLNYFYEANKTINSKSCEGHQERKKKLKR